MCPHVTPVFLHVGVSQAVWSGTCIIKTLSVQLSSRTLSFSLVLKGRLFSITFYPFSYLWRRLFITSLLHQTFIQLAYSFLELTDLVGFVCQVWDLWIVKCILRYLSFFIFALVEFVFLNGFKFTCKMKQFITVQERGFWELKLLLLWYHRCFDTNKPTQLP